MRKLQVFDSWTLHTSKGYWHAEHQWAYTMLFSMHLYTMLVNITIRPYKLESDMAGLHDSSFLGHENKEFCVVRGWVGNATCFDLKVGS